MSTDRPTTDRPNFSPELDQPRQNARPQAAPDTAASTFLVHGKAHTNKWNFNHHIVPPMSASVSYRLDSASRGACGFKDFAAAEAHKGDPVFIYDRLDEPTRSMLEENLAWAERGKTCVAFATGMAAISAALGVCLKAGDHVLSHRTVYGCTYSLFTSWYPRLNIDVELTDLRDINTVKGALRPQTRVIYFESPVNPTLELVDIGAMRALVDAENATRPPEAQIRIIVDNTFATPIGQRPLSLGADMVVHSLTKNIGGFGTDMGGAVITNGDLEGELLVWRKDFGGALSSRSAWHILAYGLPTLPLRLAQQAQTATRVATFLEGHPAVAKVHYPGLPSFPQADLAKRQLRTPEGAFMPGNMIYFETREEPGSHQNADALIDWVGENAYCITLAVSLGQLRTLIESPGSMTHSAFPGEGACDSKIAAAGVRLSIGIESADDLIRDLKAALDHIDG